MWHAARGRTGRVVSELRWQRRLLVVLIALQLILPTLGLYLRWSAGQASSSWAWHMFSTLP